MSEPLDAGLNAVAAALTSLKPSAALDRDRLMYRAGRASVSRHLLWPLATGASSALAAVLAVVLLARPAPAPVDRVVYVPVPLPQAPIPEPPGVAKDAPAPTDAPPVALSADPWPATPYARMQDRVLRWGLDGLAEPPLPAPDPPQNLDSLLKSF
jgi:hypothetical protein